MAYSLGESRSIRLSYEGLRTMVCSRCRQDKPESAFYYRKTEGRHHPYCTACHNEYTQERFKRRKVEAISYLGGRCADCGGEFHPSVFEFHHRDPGAKDLTGNQIKRASWEKVKRELDGCDLLCANRHRLRHWGDQAWPAPGTGRR